MLYFSQISLSLFLSAFIATLSMAHLLSSVFALLILKWDLDKKVGINTTVLVNLHLLALELVQLHLDLLRNGWGET